jgi:hypothetical protein
VSCVHFAGAADRGRKRREVERLRRACERKSRSRGDRGGEAEVEQSRAVGGGL